jgi:hypothetical protein
MIALGWRPQLFEKEEPTSLPFSNSTPHTLGTYMISYMQEKH